MFSYGKRRLGMGIANKGENKYNSGTVHDAVIIICDSKRVLCLIQPSTAEITKIMGIQGSKRSELEGFRKYFMRKWHLICVSKDG